MLRALNLLLRAACLAVYAAAIVQLATGAPIGLSGRAPWIAGVLLALHVAELPIALRHLRARSGSLAAGVAWTLLFGFLYWKPLADAAASRRTSEAQR